MPSFSIGNPGEAPIDGIAVDIVKEVFRRLHIEVEFTLYPWKRVLQLAQAGERDCIAFAGKNAEREEWRVFSDIISEDRQLIYYRADTTPPFEWESYADFKGYKLGLTDGFSYGDELPKAIEELHWMWIIRVMTTRILKNY